MAVVHIDATQKIISILIESHDSLIVTGEDMTTVQPAYHYEAGTMILNTSESNVYIVRGDRK